MTPLDSTDQPLFVCLYPCHRSLNLLNINIFPSWSKRKLLEGEETHFSSGVSFGVSNHSPVGGGYGLPRPCPSLSATGSGQREKQASPERNSAREPREVKNDNGADVNSNS